RALLDDPWSVRAMNGLAQVALARRKPDDAIRFWTRSLRAAPNQRGIKREIEEFREAREGAPKPPEPGGVSGGEGVAAGPVRSAGSGNRFPAPARGARTW